MKRVFIWMSVLFLLMGFALSQENDSGNPISGEWEDVNANESMVDGLGSVDEGGDLGAKDVGQGVADGVQSTEATSGSKDGKFYTVEFYIALVLVILVLIGLGFLIWVLIRGPRNEWDKDKGFLHGLGKK